MPERPPATIGIDASRAGTTHLTGTERYSRRVIEGILALHEPERLRLYVNGDRPLALDDGARACQRLIPFPRLWTHLRLSAELARHPVNALFVPAHVVPPIHPRATVVTVHDLGYLHEPGAHTPSARRYLDWSTRWSARAARLLIAISRATRDDLIRYYGVPDGKIRVVPHGVDERFGPMDPAAAAAVAPLGVRPPYILFVGTLQPRKNLARLIRAFDRLAGERPELTLVLAGRRGWLAEQIDAALARSPHRDRILLLGHAPDDALPSLYAGASALALPSLSEGFGLPVLEAMACGTPALVSDRGALPEVGGEAALVVDPLDEEAIARGLARLLEPTERARRSETGRQWAATFTWARTAEHSLEVIREAMSMGGQPS
ncbi:MAG TPA: glycosyltransferase family 1 protein [Thermomicrobiaceae bacterium]|nr:glycosyltransferase family 1 protein [Thermomicrobiaceae bacterium]